MKKIIFSITGGIGKSIAATAVCKAIKKQYPKDELIVLTGYPEVFTNNPNVTRCYNSNNLQYFYTEHIEGRDIIPMLFDPYLAPDFIKQKGHLIQVWCEMNGVKYNGELPELFLTHKEKSEVSSLIRTDKPLMLIQSNGGMPNQTDKYSWPRDMPISLAQKVVNALVDRYTVVHIRRQDQMPLQNTHVATAEFRMLAALISMSEKCLFIDSFAQHTAAALGKPSVVLWIANTPSQFGYAMHNNIIANPTTVKTDLKNSVLSQYNIIGPASEFPYNSEDEIFDFDKIMEALVGDKKQAAADSKKKLKLVS